MTAREMPAAAASRDIAVMKALKSPPHCAAGADLANKTERTNAASRRLIMLKPFFRRRCDNRMGAGVGATTSAAEKKLGPRFGGGGRRGSVVERLIDRFGVKPGPRGGVATRPLSRRNWNSARRLAISQS